MVSIAKPVHPFRRHSDLVFFDQNASLFDSHMADCLPDSFPTTFPRTSSTVLTNAVAATSTPLTAFVDPSLYSEPNYLFNSPSSPALVSLDLDDTASGFTCPSELTSASVASSALSSPLSNSGGYSTATTQASSDWASLVLGPSIISPHLSEDFFSASSTADCPWSTLESFYPNSISLEFGTDKSPPDFVDPNLIAQLSRSPMSPLTPVYSPSAAQNCPMSPFPRSSPTSQRLPSGNQVPSQFLEIALQPSPLPPYSQYPSSLITLPVLIDVDTPPPPQRTATDLNDGSLSGDDTKDKPRCNYPGCGRAFKDLKSHMLTHQTERPEKCPLQTCEYHIKGFARRYDKNRHTLTHYKGTMVCGFCPGSGSASGKSFNRADVFKRHLTAVHGVEQTAPNSRKRTSSGTLINSSGAGLGQSGAARGASLASTSVSVSSLLIGGSTTRKLAGYPPDATGKCSTCSQTFVNAQEFYEHLDECVLRIVQQEDPAEAINTRRLAEVEYDEDVARTMEKHNLPVTSASSTTVTSMHDGPEDGEPAEDEDHEAMDDIAVNEGGSGNAALSPTFASKKRGKTDKHQLSLDNGTPKSRGMTHSRGGVPVIERKRVRKNRSHYPTSWGFDKGQMKMRKRVMAVFDGQRRLAKDDMLLSTDHEVRVHLEDGKSYVTDLDVLSLRRASALHNATEDEKGPWISDDPTEEDMVRMREMQVQQMLERGEVFEPAR